MSFQVHTKDCSCIKCRVAIDILRAKGKDPNGPLREIYVKFVNQAERNLENLPQHQRHEEKVSEEMVRLLKEIEPFVLQASESKKHDTLVMATWLNKWH